MTQTRMLIYSVLVFNTFLNSLFGQAIGPKMDSLRNRITRLTYSNQYEAAQTLTLDYLKDNNLSPLEKFYGHFIFADIVKSSGNSEQAVKLLLKSSSFLPDIPNKKIYESLIFGNIGECYFNIHDYTNAQKYALQSIQVSPDSSFRGSGHAVNNIIIGFSAYQEKKYKIALDYYNNAITQYLKHNETCELPLCYIKIAAVQLDQNNSQAAQKTLEQSVWLSDSCDIDKYRLLTSMALFEYYKKNQQYKEAMTILESINAINNKLYDEGTAKSMRDLEVKYETELTQKENENLKENARLMEERSYFRTIIFAIILFGFVIILVIAGFALKLRNRKNQRLSEQLQQIEAQNDERKTLLKEIHHRVKNNLQVITSLLSLQAAQINDEEVSNLFQQSQYRINTMAMVHELLYQSDDLSKINLKSYLQELSSALILSIKGKDNNIDLQLNIPHVELDLDAAIPLGLLVNEILTNALQHGLKNTKEGHIYIHLETIGTSKYCLKIGDNGMGCPDNITFTNNNTLGLKLVYKLARQLSGTIKVDKTKEGCHYVFWFEA